MKVLSEDGINWKHFYSFEEMSPGKAKVEYITRCHKRDDTPKEFEITGSIKVFCNEQGKSGYDLAKYRETGEKIRHKETHVILWDGREFELV